MSIMFACLFLLEFLGISAYVILLSYYLNKKKNVVHKGVSSVNFAKGMCTLISIVFIFGLSFLVRVLNDAYINHYTN